VRLTDPISQAIYNRILCTEVHYVDNYTSVAMSARLCACINTLIDEQMVEDYHYEIYRLKNFLLPTPSVVQSGRTAVHLEISKNWNVYSI